MEDLFLFDMLTRTREKLTLKRIENNLNNKKHKNNGSQYEIWSTPIQDGEVKTKDAKLLESFGTKSHYKAVQKLLDHTPNKIIAHSMPELDISVLHWNSFYGQHDWSTLKELAEKGYRM